MNAKTIYEMCLELAERSPCQKRGFGVLYGKSPTTTRVGQYSVPIISEEHLRSMLAVFVEATDMDDVVRRLKKYETVMIEKPFELMATTFSKAEVLLQEHNLVLRGYTYESNPHI